ncbi:hypothetical protein PRIC1_002832 [Phytophthora ramorum]
MRVPYVVLMILVILVANADTVAALTRSKQITTSETTPSLLSLPRLLAGVPTEKRLLRTTDVVTDEKADSEERVSIPGLSRIAELASNIVPAASMKLWLATQTSPKDVFRLLNIKHLRDSTTKLDDNVVLKEWLIQWLRYTMSFRAQEGKHAFYYGEAYLVLTKAAPESELATFFLTLKNIPELKSLGEKLQKAQYDIWIWSNVVPDKVATMMRVTSHTKITDPNYAVYLGYTQQWLNSPGVKPIF